MSRLCLIINIEQPYNGINEKITNMNLVRNPKLYFYKFTRWNYFKFL